MCVNPGTQYNYGQSAGGAWNPASRDPVYQQVQRARSDPGFAQFFVWDIITAKPESGNGFYTYDMAPVEDKDAEGNVTGARMERTLKLHPQQNDDGYGYLYTKHQLNASQSWVAQAFGNPAVKGGDGKWYMAARLTDSSIVRPEMSATKNFQTGNPITDAQTVRLLNEGHYAFSAKGTDGTEVFVPWAAGYVPGKSGGERPEMGNAKDAQAGAGREAQMVDPGRATPGNVIGGNTSLLGNSREQERKTLLGK